MRVVHLYGVEIATTQSVGQFMHSIKTVTQALEKDDFILPSNWTYIEDDDIEEIALDTQPNEVMLNDAFNLLVNRVVQDNNDTLRVSCFRDRSNSRIFVHVSEAFTELVNSLDAVCFSAIYMEKQHVQTDVLTRVLETCKIPCVACPSWMLITTEECL